jgi:GT2 family glycosyltransferase
MNKVSVIIVNYNGETVLEGCLDSVLASFSDVPIEIIVIDNLSTDRSLDILKTYKSKIKVLKNSHNSGFSRGNNIAVSYASGNYFFFLNNDTKINTDTIKGLFDFMQSSHNVGAVMPRLVNKDGSIQCPGSIFVRKTFLSNETKEITFMPGAAFMMSKALYEETGGFDDNYLFYNEDTDLSRTIRKKGFKLMYFPQVSLIHYGGIATSFRKIHTLCEGYRGGIYFTQKHFGYLIALIYRVLLLVDVLPRLIYHGFVSLLRFNITEYLKIYFKLLGIILCNAIVMKQESLTIEELS